MKHWLVGLVLAFGLTLAAPAANVAAGDSDGDSDSGWSGGSKSGESRGVPELDPGASGSALVLLLGGVAYLASRRRDEK